jgi:putative ABC transport system permease protein
MTYWLQPLTDVYFGPRALGEEARHGDAYSVTILICIASLILFLALSSYINLTTLTLPYRSKEFAVKKLAGIGPRKLLFSFAHESFALVGLSLGIGILILMLSSGFTETLLGLRILPLLLQGDPRLLLVISVLFLVVSLSPVFMVLRFIKATPNRLLSTETISFPGIKHTIAFLQLGISIFLIVASVVVRRQINYSLLKEPGRNHDQVVYLNCPAGITNEGIYALRSGWQKFNPNILDVMAVSQLPDRLSSKEVGTDFYSLQVDRGFFDFFGLQMEEGNWFRVNAGDSIVVTNKTGKRMMGNDTTNVIGVVGDLSGRFNQPEKPVKIRLARDFNYNWICVRVLEVDIRRTVAYLSKQFSSKKEKSVVHFLNKRFEDWLAYQDRLNVLSGILAVISALLSCCAIYGLSVSLVRDKLKQIAVRKLLGAHTSHITGLLMIDFGKQMLLALIVFAPVTYIFLNELLRTFVYATKFQWLDPVYPIAYCALVITCLCGFQAFSLNRADLTSALKG